MTKSRRVSVAEKANVYRVLGAAFGELAATMSNILQRIERLERLAAARRKHD